VYRLKKIDLTLLQQQIVSLPLQSKVFLQGQAGSGKTTAAVQRMIALIQRGVPAESILILVPQRSLAQPFKEVINTPQFQSGGEPAILTIGGLAQRMLTLFWPLVAKNAGFTSPDRPPHFLTLETAQYYLARLVEPLLQKGYFESVTIDPNRLYSQILDNLNKSAVVGFPPSEISSRLIQAWTGKPSQSIIYEQAQECALLFREFCYRQNLLDFSLQLSVFTDHLWPSLLCTQFLTSNYQHLIYDNAEEDYPVAHDIIQSWLPDFETALIITDSDGGFRSFMGADPVSADRFAAGCEKVVELQKSFVKTEELNLLENTLCTSLQEHRFENSISPDIEKAFSIHAFRFYPQVMDWISTQVFDLIHNQNIPAEEIVILTPFLSDSLRYSINTRFNEIGLKINTFRPSRSLKDEPAVKAVITLAKLAYPSWGLKPSKDEMRNAMLLTLEDCDYIRADLISQILFSAASGTLRSFDPIKKEMQQRLTYVIGERFEKLRLWLENNASAGSLEIDIFISRLFGEILSQPGYKFHQNYDAAAAVNRLVESARKFRQVMAEDSQQSTDLTNKEYIRLVETGILSAQYLTDWTTQARAGAVLISPAFSYLMSNRPTRIQFWLDIGSQGWWTRLDQPLTHPYVLNRNWQSGRLWTDNHEHNANQQALARVASGLIRSCSDHIYMCTLSVNEQGNEERGALIMAVQSILRKLRSGTGEKNV
jgi:superfamily I DNA/RNA helicase